MNLPVPAPTLPQEAAGWFDEPAVVRELRSPAPGLPVVAMPAHEDELEDAALRTRRSQVEESVLVTIAPEDCACELCRHHMAIFGKVLRNELRQAKKLRRK